MRKKSKKQMPLMPEVSDHPQSVELENISRILDANPTICDLAMQDLSDVSKNASRSGARGMTADQENWGSSLRLTFENVIFYTFKVAFKFPILLQLYFYAYNRTANRTISVQPKVGTNSHQGL